MKNVMLHGPWALTATKGNMVTADTVTDLQPGMTRRVCFLHSSLGQPLRAGPLMLKNPSVAGSLLPAPSGGERRHKLCAVHSLLSRAAGKTRPNRLLGVASNWHTLLAVARLRRCVGPNSLGQYGLCFFHHVCRRMVHRMELA